MGSSICKIVMVGNLTRDARVFTMQSGHKVASFSLAVSKEFKTNSGELKAKTNYPNVKVWGKDAEVVEQLHKGDCVCVLSDEIETGSYEKDGRKVYTTDVVASKVIPLVCEGMPGGKQIESFAELSMPEEQEGGDADVPF